MMGFDSTLPGILPADLREPSDLADTTIRTRARGTEHDLHDLDLDPVHETMTAREWMSLGALCAQESDNMRKAGSFAAAKHYAALARKCDRMVDES